MFENVTLRDVVFNEKVPCNCKLDGSSLTKIEEKTKRHNEPLFEFMIRVYNFRYLYNIKYEVNQYSLDEMISYLKESYWLRDAFRVRSYSDDIYNAHKYKFIDYVKRYFSIFPSKINEVNHLTKRKKDSLLNNSARLININEPHYNYYIYTNAVEYLKIITELFTRYARHHLQRD